MRKRTKQWLSVGDRYKKLRSPLLSQEIVNLGSINNDHAMTGMTDPLLPCQHTKVVPSAEFKGREHERWSQDWVQILVP